ncbi:MAG: phosphate acyltransferase PlsX [Thermoanaerobaculia bacterium]
MRIAVDAMGGDYAPQEIVLGSIMANKKYGIPVTLVGRAENIYPYLSSENNLKGFQIMDAPEVVGMAESPTEAFKNKKKSSLKIALELVKEREALSMVSAGNSGAVLTFAAMTLGLIKGIDRPALAAPLPNLQNFTIVIDVGANVDCKPKNLFQFAIMGHYYAQLLLKIKNPKIGIVSIGEEEGKGNLLVKETHNLLKKSNLNFIGNVEGRDIFLGKCDVAICDGFVGNVILKTAEGVGELIAISLKKEITSSLKASFGFLLSKGAFKNFYKKIDYSEYGGAPLLGVKGGCFICHGRSKAKAICNAIKVAYHFAEEKIVEKIQEHMKEFSILERFHLDWRN